jgi:hypothetical protein
MVCETRAEGYKAKRRVLHGHNPALKNVTSILLMICSMTCYVPQTMTKISGHCTGIIWKETAILQIELHSGIYMKWLMEITKSSVKMASAWAEIPHWQLTYIQYHCYMNLLGRGQQEATVHTHRHCHKAPPSLSTYGSRWTEITYNTVLRHTSTLDILPQTAVNKQWHYVGVWLHTNQTYNKHCTVNYPMVHWS